MKCQLEQAHLMMTENKSLLLQDMNGIIHPCFHPEDRVSRPTNYYKSVFPALPRNALSAIQLQVSKPAIQHKVSNSTRTE